MIKQKTLTTSAHPGSRVLLPFVAFFLLSVALVRAQTPLRAEIASADPTEAQPTESASAAPNTVLPEAPLPVVPLPQVRSSSTPPPPGTPQAKHIVPINDLFVPAGWRAQPMSAHNKVVAGAKDLISVENIGAIVISAGYSEITNGLPNYGTGADAFGKRLGAAAIRETSQTLFSEVVLAPLLHEDSRYYQKGPASNPIRRTLYAITRPLITRSDNGSETVNGSLLLGYAAAAAITPAYYPSINRNFHDTAATFGGSIGGAAIGFFVSEFSTDVLQAFHLRRADQ